MQFDDRLKTVLMQPVEDSHDRTVRWRQLVDLLSRMNGTDDEGLVEAALAMVRRERRQIPDAARAATVRAIAGRANDPRLIAIFAQDKLAIAAPLLAASSLDEKGWAMVDANASDDIATLLESLGRSRIVEAQPENIEEIDPQSTGDEAIFLEPMPVVEEIDEAAPSIGEMVARIERLRTLRDPVEQAASEAEKVAETEIGEVGAEAAVDAEAPSEVSEGPALGDEPVEDFGHVAVSEADKLNEVALFRWECDASGQIAWVDGVPRGSMVGRSLADEEDSDRELVRALNDRAPFDGAMLKLIEPKVQGDWRLSGIPAFSPRDGSFLGYRGIARKEVEVVLPKPVGKVRRTRVNRDLDALRETVHEIKTPLNAIIGFAEIIDGQYLGPAHRNYRLRAAEIVGQARTLMGAIEDLDYAARLQAEISSEASSTPVGELMGDIQRDLDQRAAQANVELGYAIEPGISVGTGSELAGRLIRRFLVAVIAAGEAGERFEVRISRATDRRVAISVGRPMVTVGLDEGALLDPSYVAGEGEGPNILGLGFALRMVRGLARMVGGEVQAEPGSLTVFLPQGRS